MRTGHITTQGQIVADLLARDGYEVTSVSSKLNRILRLCDVIWTIFCKREAIDLLMIEVYSGLSFVLADAASLLGKFFGIPVIFVLHGGNLPGYSGTHPRWVNRVLGRGKLLVAPSEYLAREMASLGFHVRVVPNVVSISEDSFRLRRHLAPKLLWMRSFHPIYNPRMAVEVFAKVRADHPDATLVMAGVDKGMEGEVKALAADLGLHYSVSFAGFLDAAAKAREFSEADIYLNTNTIDNMPVSVVEACAYGLPVVATNVGGLPHLINNGEDGLLIPNGDADAAAEAIERLLTEPDLAERISRNGHQLAGRSDWRTVRGLWAQLFDEVLNRTDQSTVRKTVELNIAQ
jgi:glycosyltransferase involved in cell wall biosynthesis